MILDICWRSAINSCLRNDNLQMIKYLVYNFVWIISCLYMHYKVYIKHVYFISCRKLSFRSQFRRNCFKEKAFYFQLHLHIQSFSSHIRFQETKERFSWVTWFLLTPPLEICFRWKISCVTPRSWCLGWENKRALVGEKVESLRRSGAECVYLDTIKLTGRGHCSGPCGMWWIWISMWKKKTLHNNGVLTEFGKRRRQCLEVPDQNTSLSLALMPS